MQTNEFEKAFGDFIDRREYDEAQNALHSMVRTSFTAGWNAAGGEPPVPHRIFELLPGSEHQGDADETEKP